MKKTKSERNKSSHSHSGEKKEHPFNQVLSDAIEEQEATPILCHNTTYGQDSKLQTFHYQPREYHY